MTKLTATLTLALSLTHAGSLLAQRGLRTDGEARPGNPVQRFESVAPKLGALMPDLSLHDSAGEKLRLRELLDGHFTVLVLGCLT